jgi:hypothetical protein
MKMIKGDSDIKELLIKVPHGLVGGPYFSINEMILVCLQRSNDDIYNILPANPVLPDGRILIEGSWAVLWQETNPNKIALRDLDSIIGRIIKIMRINNIPIAIPEKERSPEPTGSINPRKGFNPNR